MKLQIEEKFSLEVGSDIYTGLFLELNKKQLKELDSLTPKESLKQATKLSKQITKLNAKVETSKKREDWDKVEKLQTKLDTLENKEDDLLDIINDYDIDTMYKKRLQLSIQGEDKQTILDLGDVFSYQQIFKTIIKDIEERNEKN